MERGALLKRLAASRGRRAIATYHDAITPEQAALIRDSKLFFVASVAPDLADGPHGQGPVNVSPKGATPLHVIDEHRVAYLHFQGSGNETARHAEAGGPVTVMVMSMDAEDAAIVRLYGRARAMPIDESDLREQLTADEAAELGLPGVQAIEVTVERTQTSCGYGVPVFEYLGERTRAQRGRRFKARSA